jgi:hypothetical protein
MYHLVVTLGVDFPSGTDKQWNVCQAPEDGDGTWQ